MLTDVARVEPGTFEPENHFYPRVLNDHIHPVVRELMELEMIASRFCHLIQSPTRSPSSTSSAPEV